MDSLSAGQAIIKWYHRPVWVFAGIAALGPLAFPMLWMSPVFRLWHKIVISIVVIALTIWLIAAYIYIVSLLIQRINTLKGLY